MYLVSSYPKSGATWFQFLMYNYFHEDLKSSFDVLKFYPPIHNSQLIEKNLKRGKTFFVKSHLPYSTELPYHNSFKGFIYIYRNPLDVLNSLNNHHINEGSLRLKFSYFRNKLFEQEVQKALNAETKSWNTNMTSWFTNNLGDKLFLIKYEDLLKDPLRTLVLLNRKLKLGWNHKFMNRAIRKSSFKNLSDLESYETKNKIRGMFYRKNRYYTKLFFNSNFINLGKSKSYTDNVPLAIQLRAIEAFQPGLKFTDYTF